MKKKKSAPRDRSSGVTGQYWASVQERKHGQGPPNRPTGPSYVTRGDGYTFVQPLSSPSDVGKMQRGYNAAKRRAAAITIASHGPSGTVIPPRMTTDRFGKARKKK